MSQDKYGGCVLINGVPISKSDEEVDRLVANGVLVPRAEVEARRHRDRARDVADFLRNEATELFNAGVFHADEYGTFSANERQAGILEAAADVLIDLYPLDDEDEQAEGVAR